MISYLRFFIVHIGLCFVCGSKRSQPCRLLIGVLSLVFLGGWLLWRRRPSYCRAPRRLVGVVGLSLALLAAAGLVLASTTGLLDASGVGTGAPLSAAVCALAAALIFAIPVLRMIREGRLTLADDA